MSTRNKHLVNLNLNLEKSHLIDSFPQKTLRSHGIPSWWFDFYLSSIVWSGYLLEFGVDALYNLLLSLKDNLLETPWSDSMPARSMRSSISICKSH